ncbi:MAG: alpha/beta fold hydrolase [Pseudoalteromonas spongiae]
MQVTITETSYEIDELKIACQRLDNSNTKIIALHGWQDNSNSFLPLINQMPQYDWYAIDFPGHGLSSWRNKQAHYYFIDYVDDVYRVLQQIAPNEKVIIVGHSMGAMVANLFAACFPDKVKCVIAIEGLACVTTPESEVTAQLRNAIESRAKPSSKRVFKRFDQVVNARLAVSDLDYDNAALIMKRNTQQEEDGIKLLTDPKLKHHSGFRFSPNQCQAICKDTTVPMLLIKALNGFKMISQAIENYGQLYTNLGVIEIPGGHHCHMEYAQVIAKEVDVYVNGVN